MQNTKIHLFSPLTWMIKAMAYQMINDAYPIPVIYHLVAKLKLIFHKMLHDSSRPAKFQEN